MVYEAGLSVWAWPADRLGLYNPAVSGVSASLAVRLFLELESTWKSIGPLFFFWGWGGD